MSDLERMLQTEWATRTKNLDPKKSHALALCWMAFDLACRQQINLYDVGKVLDWWKKASGPELFSTERRHLNNFVRLGEMAKKNPAIPLVWEEIRRSHGEVDYNDAALRRFFDAMLRQLARNQESSQETLLAVAEEAFVPPRGWFRLRGLLDGR